MKEFILSLQKRFPNALYHHSSDPDMEDDYIQLNKKTHIQVGQCNEYNIVTEENGKFTYSPTYKNTSQVLKELEIAQCNLDQLTVAIDEESVNIYFDMGEDEEPIHVVYWHEDEFLEDSSVIFSALNAVDMANRNPQELLERLELSHLVG